MNRTVDVVVAGAGRGVVVAAASALAERQRVLVLLQSRDGRVARRLRRRLDAVAARGGGACVVEHGVDVVCVDGVGGVEAVVYRHRRTGRVAAVNAGAFASADDRAPDEKRRPGAGDGRRGAPNATIGHDRRRIHRVAAAAGRVTPISSPIVITIRSSPISTRPE